MSVSEAQECLQNISRLSRREQELRKDLCALAEKNKAKKERIDEEQRRFTEVVCRRLQNTEDECASLTAQLKTEGHRCSELEKTIKHQTVRKEQTASEAKKAAGDAVRQRLRMALKMENFIRSLWTAMKHWDAGMCPLPGASPIKQYLNKCAESESSNKAMQERQAKAAALSGELKVQQDKLQRLKFKEKELGRLLSGKLAALSSDLDKDKENETEPSKDKVVVDPAIADMKKKLRDVQSAFEADLAAKQAVLQQQANQIRKIGMDIDHCEALKAQKHEAFHNCVCAKCNEPINQPGRCLYCMEMDGGIQQDEEDGGHQQQEEGMQQDDAKAN
ncbi:unnamed protein product [Vitrella brassicaformis CCMP3155]|uniref:Uncharacterized protein n=1 Tax=Vitrella brassicaformis (strain CCMP3155) TaxID=1169540 RepID=A0A0G4EJQ1_VITBC|nr:unnamed protein product [Vitrella brassicaformis CCMP3155]|eukprot:CEL96616.1 unnamed protein product [Vitrella brassicaformis CCMP3155]